MGVQSLNHWTPEKPLSFSLEIEVQSTRVSVLVPGAQRNGPVASLAAICHQQTLQCYWLCSPTVQFIPILSGTQGTSLFSESESLSVLFLKIPQINEIHGVCFSI